MIYITADNNHSLNGVGDGVPGISNWKFIGLIVFLLHIIEQFALVYVAHILVTFEAG